MIQLTDKIFAFKVPEGATNIEICNYGLNDALEYDYNGTHGVDDLPPGSYTFLFCTSEVTEEQAHAVVEHVITANELPVYRDYVFSMWMSSAVGSLRSLLRSKGCEGDWVVVEKQL